MNVLFLDVDGVLNGYSTKAMVCGYVFVDDEKLELLKAFIDKNNLVVVLTSTWRHGLIYIERFAEDETYIITPDMAKEIECYEALEEKLKEYGIEIYGRTDMLDEYNRGFEIADWLEKNPNVEKMVILDDKSRMKPYGRYLVQTSVVDGMTEKHLKRAQKILDEQVKNKED